jgi:hypothetical protein
MMNGAASAARARAVDVNRVAMYAYPTARIALTASTNGWSSRLTSRC